MLPDINADVLRLREPADSRTPAGQSSDNKEDMAGRKTHHRENFVLPDGRKRSSFCQTTAKSKRDEQMEHLSRFQPRDIRSLPVLETDGWQLKQYAILSDGRSFDPAVAEAAGTEALRRLPPPGGLEDPVNAHGIGFQIVHFAQVAVVAPVFYWQWGSVLSKIGQLRASWQTPTLFEDGVEKVIGCLWEMDIVSFETNTWKTTVLSGSGTPAERLAAYMATWMKCPTQQFGTP